MPIHYHFSEINPDLEIDAKYKGISVRNLINGRLAPHFVMNYIVLKPNQELFRISEDMEQDLYVLKGKMNLQSSNESSKNISQGDFLYLPKNPNFTLQNPFTEDVEFLQVKRLSKWMEDFQSSSEVLHFHQSLIPKKDVTNFGSTKTTIQVFNNDQDQFPFIMRRFVLNPQGNIGIHNHSWEHEMFLVEGEMTLISDIPDDEENINANEFIFMPPNEKHGYVNHGVKPAVFICMIPKKSLIG